MVGRGEISIGDLTSFLMYTVYAGSSISGLSSFYSELMKGVGAASRIFELLDRKPTISPTKGIRVENARGLITFDNVHFAYPTRPSLEIFKGLSFSIPPGMNVSIVGPSGGGKSTISSLLLGYYRPTSGEITINGVDISSFNVKQLRRQISIVSQEPVLYSGSLAENIAYGKPNATRDEIEQAALRANCDFIANFPEGLDTQVGSRGTQLSGGQKQRIAIARALIREPAILILDEATSALDATSEYLVNEALARLMRLDSTTITIAHRLATIRRADKIIVLSPEGDVAEEGTFQQLANRDGAFNKLMKMQLDQPIVNTPTPDHQAKEEEHDHNEEHDDHDEEQEDDGQQSVKSPLLQM